MNDWDDDFEYVGNAMEEESWKVASKNENWPIGCSAIFFFFLLVFVIWFWQYGVIH